MATFRGTSKRDIINGTADGDFIQSVGGDDLVRGGDGADRIEGGSGNDELFGDAGNDTLLGGSGLDILRGGDGNDFLFGDADNDQLFGGAGNDSLDGGAGDDLLDAGGGDDTITDLSGANSILGGGGLDTITTGAGSDTIDGGNGADKINAGAGQDFITLGGGNDIVTFDFNVLRTGDADRSTRQVIAGEDFITDFTRGSDVLTLDAADFRIFGALNFVNALAADLPASGANFIVLQDSDNDNNPATPFNAGSAANLIAAQVQQDGAGFFIYFNSDLQLNRLVYSENLNDATADLQIVARFTNETGADAIAALPQFTAANFDLINEELNVRAFPVEVELQPGGNVFFVGVDGFSDAYEVFGADRDSSFNPGRAPVITFDPTTDVVQIDQALIALDQFVELSGIATPAVGGREDTFFKFTTGIGGIGEINSDSQAGKAFAGLRGEGLALYYDAADDTVNVALIQANDQTALQFRADVILEFDVNGKAEGIALINALSPANFQIASAPDVDPNAIAVNDPLALATLGPSEFALI